MDLPIIFGLHKVRGTLVAVYQNDNLYHICISFGYTGVHSVRAIYFDGNKINMTDIITYTEFDDTARKEINAIFNDKFKLVGANFIGQSIICLLDVKVSLIKNLFNIEFLIMGITTCSLHYYSNCISDNVLSVILTARIYMFTLHNAEEMSLLLLKKTCSRLNEVVLKICFYCDAEYNIYYVYTHAKYRSLYCIQGDFTTTNPDDLIYCIRSIHYLTSGLKVSIRFELLFPGNITIGEMFQLPKININLNHNFNLTNLPNISTKFLNNYKNIICHYLDKLSANQNIKIEEYYIGTNMNLYAQNFIDLIKEFKNQYTNFKLCFECLEPIGILIYHEIYSLMPICWTGEKTGYSLQELHIFFTRYKKDIIISRLGRTYDTSFEEAVEELYFWRKKNYVKKITFAEWHLNNLEYDLNHRFAYSRERDLFYTFFKKCVVFGFERSINYIINWSELEAKIEASKFLGVIHNDKLFVFDIYSMMENYKNYASEVKLILGKFFIYENYRELNNVKCTKIYVEYDVKINKYHERQAEQIEIVNQEEKKYFLTEKILVAFIEVFDMHYKYNVNASISSSIIYKSYDKYVGVVEYNKEYIYIYSYEKNKVVYGNLSHFYNKKYFYYMSEIVNELDIIIELTHLIYHNKQEFYIA